MGTRPVEIRDRDVENLHMTISFGVELLGEVPSRGRWHTRPGGGVYQVYAWDEAETRLHGLRLTYAI